MNVLKQLYLASDYHDESGMIFNADCMEVMSSIKQGGVSELKDIVGYNKYVEVDSWGWRQRV